METKIIYLLGIALAVVAVICLVVFVTTSGPPPGGQPGCQPPKKLIGNVCCSDDNKNNVCDSDEAGCPASCDDNNTCTNDVCSAGTNFKCEHRPVANCCGNGICEPSEDVNNICPQDCTVIKITDFQFGGTPDYIEGGTFVFIHTVATAVDYRLFFLNITAGVEGMGNVKYTFKCNSTKHTNLDSILSITEKLTEEISPVINKLNETHYLVYSYFFFNRSRAYDLSIESLDPLEKAQFHFKMNKKEPQKRDDLSCLFSFYFMQPRKIVQKWLKISFI